MASIKNETPVVKKGKSQGHDANSSPGLKVTAKLDGFCRAGLTWSDRPTVVKLSVLNEDQIAEIKRCPGLIVTEVDVEEDEPGEADDTGNNESQGESA